MPDPAEKSVEVEEEKEATEKPQSQPKNVAKTESKDTVIFLTEEEANVPSKVTLEEAKEDEGPPGLILPNGDINWNCPCLGGMAVGPCGVEFRAAFSCFHYSTADPKGSDCIDKFADMQICMSGYPELYDKKEKGEEEEGEAPGGSESKPEETSSSDEPKQETPTDASGSSQVDSSSSSPPSPPPPAETSEASENSTSAETSESAEVSS